jgi:hypothetical protein
MDADFKDNELVEYSQRRSNCKMTKANAYRLEALQEDLVSSRITKKTKPKPPSIILQEFIRYKNEERKQLENREAKIKEKQPGFFEKLYWYIRNKYFRKKIDTYNSVTRRTKYDIDIEI